MMGDLTPRAQQALALSKRVAIEMNCKFVGTEHLLVGIITLGQGVAVNALLKMGVDFVSLRTEVEEQCKKSGKNTNEKINENEVSHTPRLKKVIALAGKEAKNLSHSYIGTEHLLLGLLLDTEGLAYKILNKLDIDHETCRKEILSEIDPNFESEDMESAFAGGNTEKRESSSKTPALKSFGRELVELAKNGKIDPVIGRKDEIARMIQILCRRTKNNPILIGEAGVGKTAIVEGLAQEIALGTVPEMLLDKKVYMLDLASMVAGTKYRGQFEERIKSVMKEVQVAGNIILFIDELHTIVGAGAAEGSMDASNIIKPALSRGELQCVGATTMEEYRKYIEKDNALERRFQQVQVAPPSVDDAILILRGIRHKYEEHHSVEYSDESLVSAVKLSDRYITGRFLPDKAIDILDETGSCVRIESLKKPKELDHLEDKIKESSVNKEECVTKQKFEDAAKWRDKERSQKERRDTLLERWKTTRKDAIIPVNEDDVLKTISAWTKVPLSRMEKTEAQRLLGLEKRLQAKVIGQDYAGNIIAKALRRSRVDLKDPKRPIGSFMFLGPTGVGKTYLAKCLAEDIFGSQDNILQIDMSEYMEKHSVSRLIGSPPGYVGYEDAGQLTEAVRRNPYSVVLFDEIEKAHPDICQLLLQVLEDGHLTDNVGRRIDFRNTIVIMTSNVGADILQRNVSLGFGAGQDAENDYETTKAKILEESKKTFRPEFLNRLDDLVIFRKLTKDHITQIVELEIEKLRERVKQKGYSIRISKAVKEFLVEEGYDEKMGARPLRRAVERYLEDTLAESILHEEVASGQNNLLVAKIKDKKEIYFEASSTPTPAPVKKDTTDSQKDSKVNQKK
jgi:ATP-dependent Clp protease ATP-binding subunit ClpC